MTSRRLDYRPAAARAVLVDALERRLLLSVSPHIRPVKTHSVLTHAVTVPVKPKATANVKSQSAAKASWKASLRARFGSAVGIPTAIVSAAAPADNGSPAVPPYTPSDIRRFYNADNISFNGVAGTGSGETIAIIDAFNTPNLVSSTDPGFVGSDLQVFDHQYGLSDPVFTKVSETGTAAVPAGTNTGWDLEACLDVEWAHVMAPLANIVLFEANSASLYDLIGVAVPAAASYPGVVAVSMSFVDSESDGGSAYDGDFTSTSQGVTFLAATGDQGASSTGFPSLSPNVVAVGGTSITTNGDNYGDYGSETVWNNNYGATGGAPSTIEARPSYQSGLTIAGSTRLTPDVAFDADPGSGVSVYDSNYGSGSGWYRVGGTSVSCPCWAGLVAIADQGRASIGLGSIDGRNVTLPRLYGLPATDFNDITTGNNGGYSAGVGYDEATGLGTPISNVLVPDLAGGATITGRAFVDRNGTGIYVSGDRPIGGTQVYLDLANSGVFQTGDPTAYTNSAGIYTFADQAGHESGTVRLVTPPAGGPDAYLQEPGSTALATSFGGTQTVNIVYYATSYPDTAMNDYYTVQLDPTGTMTQIYLDGNLIGADPVSGSAVTISMQGSYESVTVNASAGNPIPAGGLIVNGTGGLNNSLLIIGTGNGDSYNVTSGSVVFSGRTITESSVSSLTITPGLGTNALSIASGSAILSAAPAGGGIVGRTFSSILIGSTGSLSVATAAAHTDRRLILTQAVSIATGGRVDLGGNDLVLQAGGASGLATLNALAGQGYNLGNWTGTGLDSSAAAADPRHLTALGVATGSAVPAGKTFDGYSPAAADVLVKFTYYGDTNLDGKVDGSDYSKIDFAYAVKSNTGWANGDFNYDGFVDGTDYSLIDNAENNQGAQM